MDEGLLAKAVDALAASTKALADAEERWIKVREEENARDAERSERFHKDGVRLNEEAQKVGQENNAVLRLMMSVVEKQVGVTAESVAHNKAIREDQLAREARDAEWLALKLEADMATFKDTIEYRKRSQERKAKEAAEVQ